MASTGLGVDSLIGLGAGVLGAGFGILQKLKANSLERKNKLPVATVNNNIATNAAIARNMAKVGLSQTQYNNAVNAQNQNLSTVLSSASRSGRNLPVAGILRQANTATQSLDAQDEAARYRNQLTSFNQNAALAGEEQRVWNWNFANPYLRTAQQVASMRNAGNQNLFGGIGLVGQMGMSGAFGGSQKQTV